MNNTLIFFILLLQTILLLLVAFWIVNKNCLICQQELPAKRIFTFKSNCKDCERSQNE